MYDYAKLRYLIEKSWFCSLELFNFPIFFGPKIQYSAKLL